MFQGEMVLRLREYGEAVLGSLKSNDSRLGASVQLDFLDGSHSTFARSFTELAGDWLFVFSVTDGYYVFRKANVVKWNQDSTPAGTHLSWQPVAHGSRHAA